MLCSRDYGTTDTAIIREVYDSENAHEAFGEELERALEAGCQMIIIEPSRLGDETARWIAVGNCLHKTAVVAGLGSIVTGRQKLNNKVFLSCDYIYMMYSDLASFFEQY